MKPLVPSIFIQKLLKVLIQSNDDAINALRDVAPDAELLVNSPPALISAEKHFGALRDLSSLINLDLVVQYAQSMRASDFKEFGFAIKSASSLYEALRVFFYFQKIFAPSVRYIIEEEGDVVRLTFNHGKMDCQGKLLSAELALCAVTSIFRQAFRDTFKLKSVNFVDVRKNFDIKGLEKYFGCKINIRGDTNSLEIDKEVAFTTFPKADQEVNDYFMSYLDGFADKGNDLITNRAKQLLFDNLGKSIVSLGLLASLMSTTPKTLSRHFASTQTSYRSILGEVQFEKSKELLLNPNLPIIEIANSVGFKEQSSFQKAFKKWSGMTPRKYRILHA